MRIVIGSDHAGWPLKERVMEHVRALGHQVVDVGAYDDRRSIFRISPGRCARPGGPARSRAWNRQIGPAISTIVKARVGATV